MPSPAIPTRRTGRAVSCCAAALLLVTACAPMSGQGPATAPQVQLEDGLTPDQRMVRLAVGRLPADRTYLPPPEVQRGQTVAEGAVVLGVLGAVAGGLIGGRGNRVEGALIGGTVGAGAGALAGSAVADNAQANANSEQALAVQIKLADDDAADFQNLAAIASRNAAAARRDIAALNARFRSRQITADQFRLETEKYRRDLVAIQSLRNDTARARDAASNASARQGNNVQLASAGNRFGQANATLGRAEADLARVLATVPG